MPQYTYAQLIHHNRKMDLYSCFLDTRKDCLQDQSNRKDVEIVWMRCKHMNHLQRQHLDIRHIQNTSRALHFHCKAHKPDDHLVLCLSLHHSFLCLKILQILQNSSCQIHIVIHFHIILEIGFGSYRYYLRYMETKTNSEISQIPQFWKDTDLGRNC